MGTDRDKKPAQIVAVPAGISILPGTFLGVYLLILQHWMPKACRGAVLCHFLPMQDWL